MADQLKADICVIGAGSGGLSVAVGAAAHGASVVLVEKGEMGGECLNTGCVPSKALIAAGRRAAQIRNAGAFGVTAGEPKVSFRRVHEHVHDVIGAIAPTHSAARLQALGVTVIKGEARLSDRRTVMVGERRIQARRFVIATGAEPAIPVVAGLSKVRYDTNETIFAVNRTPRHLAILGAGPMGVELAQAFARLGAPVTLIEPATALSREDPELAAIVMAALARDGVSVRLGARVARVTAARRGILLYMGDRPDATADDVGEEVVEASHLVLATGRRPRVVGLGLEAAGIRFDRSGIWVDSKLRTTNPRVFALGDVIGGPASTHAVTYQAGIVLRNILFRLRSRASYRHVPRVVYTDPELAQVGLTEAEARTQHGSGIRILRWPYAENDRARAEREVAGHIKVIVTRRGRVLGAGIVGPQAGELIQLWSLAVAGKLGLQDLMDLVPPYPTLGEISRRVASEFYKPGLTRPLVRRIIGFPRWFG